MKSIATKVLVLVLATLFNSSIGTGMGNTFLPKYCYWYCPYFSQVLLTSLGYSLKLSTPGQLFHAPTVSVVMNKPSTTGNRGTMFSGRTPVRPVGRPLSVGTYLGCRDISVLTGRILTKLPTNIDHVSGNFWKKIQGQRSKVNVMCVQMCKCYNGRDIPFDVALSLTCFIISRPGL